MISRWIVFYIFHTKSDRQRSRRYDRSTVFIETKNSLFERRSRFRAHHQRSDHNRKISMNGGVPRRQKLRKLCLYNTVDFTFLVFYQKFALDIFHWDSHFLKGKIQKTQGEYYSVFQLLSRSIFWKNVQIKRFSYYSAPWGMSEIIISLRIIFSCILFRFSVDVLVCTTATMEMNRNGFSMSDIRL